MSKPVVSVVKFNDPYLSLKEAIDLCDGLKGLNKSDKILIKPNLVEWYMEESFPPFGVVTTSAVMFALVRILTEEGFRNLTIGESTVLPLGTKGRDVFKALGYEKLREDYGVELIDFKEEKHEGVDFDELKFFIPKKVLEADKIINVPVLKTHAMCKVSLGLKNLKGCIDAKSKKLCHGKEVDLHHTFSRIAEKLPVALTIIDGVYTIERGPTYIGEAFRKDLLIASTDIYAADVVGAEILGYGAKDVPHLEFHAGRNGLSTDIADIEIKGDIDSHKTHLEWEHVWTEDGTGPIYFKLFGITGLTVRKYDNTLCTGCVDRWSTAINLLATSFKGKPFDNIEVLNGKKMLSEGGFNKTVLFGKCVCDANKDNPNIKKAIPIRSCPPDIEKFIALMSEEGIEFDFEASLKFRQFLFDRYKGKEEFDFSLFTAQ